MAREVSISFALTAALKGGFKSAFQGAADSARNVASAIRDMEKSPVGKLGAAMTAQREKIKGLAGSLREAKGTLSTLQAQAQASGSATGMLARQIELAQQRVNNLSGALNRQLGTWRNTTAEAATVGGSVRRLSQDYEQLSRRMERARKVQTAMAANRAQADALRSQRADLNSRLAGAAATAMTVAVPAKLSIDFEDSVAKVGAVANASDEDMKRLTETARQLGRDTVFSASQAAEGMKYLAMAGFDAKETIAAMPGMLDLAAAGNTDLGRTADIASDILSAFKLKAEDMGQVSDTLAKTFTTSNTSLEMLGDTMKYVGPVAASVGMSLQDTSAMAGMLGNVGIKASQAGTVMRAALLRLAAPPKMAKDALGELAGVAGPELDELYEQIGDVGDAQSALQELGMTTKDQAGNLRPMVDILEELNMRTANMGTADKAEVFKKVFGTEASAGMIALAEQAAVTVDKYGNKIVNSLGEPTNALRAYMEKVNQYEGTGAQIAKRMNDTTGGALRQLSSAWEDAGISVGNLFLPAIRAAAGALSTIANVISGAVQRFPTLSKGIALVVAGVAALTVGGVALGLVMNTVKTGLNAWRGILLRLAASQVTATASTGGMTLASSLFGMASKAAGAGARFFAGGLRSILVATGVGALLVALGFAINLLIDNWDAVVEAMSAAWAWVKDTWGRLGVFFTELGKNLAAIFPGVWDGICNGFDSAKNFVVGCWNGIVGFFTGLWDGIVSGVSAIGQWFSGAFSSAKDGVCALWQGIPDFFSGLWNGVVSGVSAIGQGIISGFVWAKDFIVGYWNTLLNFYSGLWNGIISGVSAIGDGISSAFTWAKDAVCGIWQAIPDFFSGLWNRVVSGVSAIGQGIISGFVWAKDFIVGYWNTLLSFYSGLWNGIISGVSAIGNGITSAFTWAKETVCNIWQGVTNFFSGLWNGVISSVSGLGQGVVRVFTWAKDFIVGYWNTLLSFYSGLWNGIISGVSAIGNGITSAFTWARDAVCGVWQNITGFFSGLWGGILDGASSLWQGVIDAASWAIDGITGIWNGAVEFFSAIAQNISAVFTWASNAVVTVWQGVTGYFASIWQGITDSASGVWQNIVDLASWAYEGVAGIWLGITEFFTGIVDSITGIFSGLFEWLQEKFAWVFSTIDAVSGVIGKITGAVGDAWNAAFGSDGDKKTAAPSAEAAKDKPVATAASAAPNAPATQSAQSAQKAPAAPNATPPKFTPVSKAAVDAQNPEPPKKTKKKAGGGGGGGSRSKSGSGGSASAGGKSDSGPVTVVKVAGDNSTTQTLFIPAGQQPSQSAAPNAARALPSQDSKGRSAGIASNSQGAVKMPALASANAGAEVSRALPQTPAMVAKKQSPEKGKDSASPTSINIDLKQQFDLITQDAMAVRKVMEAIKPDMENLVRRALEKIQSDKRRTAYAQ